MTLWKPKPVCQFPGDDIARVRYVDQNARESGFFDFPRILYRCRYIEIQFRQTIMLEMIMY